MARFIELLIWFFFGSSTNEELPPREGDFPDDEPGRDKMYSVAFTPSFFENIVPDIANKDLPYIWVEGLNSLTSSVSGLTFVASRTFAPQTADFVCRGEAHPDFPFGENTLAYSLSCGEIADGSPPTQGVCGDCYFNPAFLWGITGSPTDGVDLRTVQDHELLHSAGIEHIDVAGALMNAIYSGPIRNLQPADIRAVQEAFGPPVE